MEITVTIDITDKTKKALSDLSQSLGNLFEETALANGDFAKLAEGHQKKETVTPEVITISKEELHAECAKARVAGVNVAEIIHTAGHADKFKNLEPQYYEAVHQALQEKLNG